MAVTEGKIPVGDTGEYLDTTVVDQEDGTPAHREAVVITDPENTAARANVRASKKHFGQYAQLVNDENTFSIVCSLEMIIDQNERILMMLESIAE